MDVSNRAHIPLRRGGALGGSRASDGGVAETNVDHQRNLVDNRFKLRSVSGVFEVDLRFEFTQTTPKKMKR